jgi:mannan endo-1,4-beta-mannosidase
MTRTRLAMVAAAAASLCAAGGLSGCASPLAWKPATGSMLPAPTGPAARVTMPSALPSGQPIVPEGMLTGAYETGAPASWAGLTQFATATGVQPRIALYYSSWHESFRGDFAGAAREHGAYAFVQMQPNGVSLAGIAAGGSDSYLRAFAQSVRAFGHPVIISFGHEMNGGWYTWGSGRQSPADFVAAWRHVVDVFREEGATKVTWVWTVNSKNAATAPLAPWWPGSAYVNWVGVDGYYYHSSDTFDTVIGSTLAEIRQFSSAPVLISQVAVGVTANRSAQIASLFAGARSVKAVGLVWYDEAQSNGVYHQDWRLEDDPIALAAFTTAAAKFS